MAMWKKLNLRKYKEVKMAMWKKLNLRKYVAGFLSVYMLIFGVFMLVNLANTDRAEAAPGQEHFVIATASVGGTWYLMGAGLSMIIDHACPDLDVKAIISGGSLVNARLVDTGEVESGFCASDPAWAAYNGLEPFERKFDNFRVITKLHPGPLHIVVLEDSDIKSVYDLKGKKVAVGPAGGGAVKVLHTVLPYFGMSFDDFNPLYTSYEESCEMVGDKHVNAAAISAGIPMEAIKQLQTRKKIRLISFEKEIVDKIVQNEPLYDPFVIPKEVYDLKEDVLVAVNRDLFIVNKNVKDEAVYEVTRAIFENLDQVYKVHPSCRYITLESAVSDLFPMHPGAMKYYKEKGIVKE